jgi:hypothetical protein
MRIMLSLLTSLTQNRRCGMLQILLMWHGYSHQCSKMVEAMRTAAQIWMTLSNMYSKRGM